MFVFSQYPDGTRELDAKDGSGSEKVSSKNREAFLLQQEAEQKATHIAWSQNQTHQPLMKPLIQDLNTVTAEKVHREKEATYKHREMLKNKEFETKCVKRTLQIQTILFFYHLILATITYTAGLVLPGEQKSQQPCTEQLQVTAAVQSLPGASGATAVTRSNLRCYFISVTYICTHRPSFSFQNKQHIARRQNFIASRISMRKEHNNK